jgi:ssDNA-binding Zn-finger/Zn-ribbon topoisomerase 1
VSTIALEVQLVTINCGCCGGVYAIGERYHQQARQEGTSWNCPYCQTGWGFSGRGENRQLREELERANSRLANERARSERIAQQRDRIDASRRAVKGHLTRIRNRVKNGVCPCCNRTFSDLQRHMETKHPDFAQAAE